jgi:hypothetical protein
MTAAMKNRDAGALNQNAKQFNKDNNADSVYLWKY